MCEARVVALVRWIFSDLEHRNQTVMMAPASGFYSTPGLGKQQVRIAYVLKKEDLANAMETLAHNQILNRTVQI